MINYNSTAIKNVLKKAQSWILQEIVEIRVGSDSDIPKISVIFDKLNKAGIPYILRILSAHRTPKELIKTARELPFIRSEISGKYLENIKVRLSIAAAWGSAHIAWMTASETNVPVIAIPVSGSALWQIDSWLSMLDMPPGIPNWAIFDCSLAWDIAVNYMELNGDNLWKIVIDDDLLETKEAQNLIKYFWKEFFTTYKNNSFPIRIITHTINNWDKYSDNKTLLPVIIPTLTESIGQVDKFKPEYILWLANIYGFHQWCQIIGKINTTNAILFALKLAGRIDTKIENKLEKYRKKLTKDVKIKNKLLWEEYIWI